MIFALYLILVEMPRIDESNLIQTGLSMEECENASGALNAMAREMGDEHRHIYICGPAPVEIDHHEDELGAA